MPTTHLPLLAATAAPSQVDRSLLRSPRVFRGAVSSCELCPLSDERHKAVPGSGAPDADVMIVGVAPGRHEDVQGQPFMGAAGNVIDNALAAVGSKRAQVHLTTLVKCHPIGDRMPTMEELSSCYPWLLEQVAMVRPKVIISLGELATSVLLRRRVPISRVAGLRLSLWDDITLLPTFDPLDAARGNARAAAAIRGHVASAMQLQELVGVATA